MSMATVYRDVIKEGRTDYFVTYQPADCRFPFASLDLVFLEDRVDTARVTQAIEAEFEIWMKRYPVPLMVSAFDNRENLIRVRGDSAESHLMGYRELKTGQLFRRWGLLKASKYPQSKPMQSIYKARIEILASEIKPQCVISRSARPETLAEPRGRSSFSWLQCRF
jgi:hypothetical protein